MTMFKSHFRAFAPLYITAAAMVSLSAVSELLGNSPGLAPFFLEVGAMCLIGLACCAIAPRHPFRVAFLGVAGALIGIAIDLLVHPTVGGYERNLWPIEIVLQTAIAAFCFVATAGTWKGVGLLLAKSKEHPYPSKRKPT